jgi:hypothetical protein
MGVVGRSRVEVVVDNRWALVAGADSSQDLEVADNSQDLVDNDDDDDDGDDEDDVNVLHPCLFI